MNWSQLQTILWLRWRLSRNRFIRAGPINAVLSILMTVFMAFGAVACLVGGALGGGFLGAKSSALTLLLVWDGVVAVFLLFWFSGLMVEIQRSESIDLAKLLHLPVTLRQVFVFNYLASHFTPSILMFVPGMMGLCAGLVFGAGPSMALMAPLALGFVFMVTAWTYCLRGWLAALMINKRRRRTIVVWITIAFVLLGQLPNLIIQTSVARNGGHSRRHSADFSGFEVSDAVLQAHLFVPPGWVGYSAKALKEHNVWPVLAAIAASGLIGAAGLMRAYSMTLRFYRGAESGKTPAPAAARPVSRPATGAPLPPSRAKPLLVERTLPWLPDEVTALTLATLRSLLRAPELKMAFIMPVVLAVVLGATRFSGTKTVPPQFSPFVAAAAAVFGVFSIAHTLSNAFGLDRNGFRALILLPTRRHYILLGKNLAFFPFAALIALLMLILGKILLHISWAAFLSGLIQAPTAFFTFCLAANLLAILAPYRMAPGTLQAKKPKPIVFLAAFGVMFLLPIMAIPILIPPGLQLLFSLEEWTPWLPVNLLASLVLLPVILWLYSLLLPFEGRLLHRREQAILKEVTEETE